jgi:preprotein translocase subunit SecB
MEKQPGFHFQSIMLLESSFKRNSIIDFSKNHIPDVTISTNFDRIENELVCNVELDFSVIVNNDPIINCKCKFVGLFEIIGNPIIDVSSFGNINAPSIIFPFIREHVAGISLKAGISPILLPPVNFVEMAENKLGNK